MIETMTSHTGIGAHNINRLRNFIEVTINKRQIKAFVIETQHLRRSGVYQDNIKRLEIITNLFYLAGNVLVFAKDDGMEELIDPGSQLARHATIIRLPK